MESADDEKFGQILRVRIDDALRILIEAAAARAGKSQSEVVRKAIRRQLEGEEAKVATEPLAAVAKRLEAVTARLEELAAAAYGPLVPEPPVSPPSPTPPDYDDAT